MVSRTMQSGRYFIDKQINGYTKDSFDCAWRYYCGFPWNSCGSNYQ